MYQTQFKNPYHIINRLGEKCLTFTDYDQLVVNWGWLRKNNFGPGPSHKKPISSGWLKSYLMNNPGEFLRPDYYDFIIRDDWNNNPCLDKLEDDWWEYYKNKKKYKYSYPNARQPGRKRSCGDFFRRMATFQERKWANAWDDEEFAPKVRKRRNARNLPNSWDDYKRMEYKDNNWKRYRKTQWK